MGDAGPLLVSACSARRAVTEGRAQLVDVRWPVGGGSFDPEADPLPDAISWPWDPLLRGPEPARPAAPPDEARLRQACAAAAGPTGRRLVFVDDNLQFTGARAVWCVTRLGYAAARVDGGKDAWLAAPSSAPASAGPVRRAGDVLDAGALKDLLAAGGQLLDCRRESSWTADSRHVAGAFPLPMAALLDRAGRTRPPAQVRAVLAGRGVDAGRPLAVTCPAGISASAVWLVLASTGVEAAVYCGSLEDWQEVGGTTATR